MNGLWKGPAAAVSEEPPFVAAGWCHEDLLALGGRCRSWMTFLFFFAWKKGVF